MNAAPFLIEVQLRAGAPANVRDPLASTRIFLQERGDYVEGRVLRRFIRALLSGDGMFEEEDMLGISDDGLKLASALIDAQMRGLYKESEWRSALLRLV